MCFIEHGVFEHRCLSRYCSDMLSCVVGCLNVSLLQIYHWVSKWKNFENRSVYGEVTCESGWLCSRVVSVLDSSAEGLWLQIAAVLGKLFTPIVPLFIKQQNWYQADCQEPGSAPEPYARQSATFTLFTCESIVGPFLSGHGIYFWLVVIGRSVNIS